RAYASHTPLAEEFGYQVAADPESDRVVTRAILLGHEATIAGTDGERSFVTRLAQNASGGPTAALLIGYPTSLGAAVTAQFDRIEATFDVWARGSDVSPSGDCP